MPCSIATCYVMNSDHGGPAPDPQMVRQAIHWLLRLNNDGGNARVQRQCATWRAADRRHELAWQRIQSLSQEVAGHYRAVPGAGLALETSAQRLDRRQALKLLGVVGLMGSTGWLGKDLEQWQQWSSDYATGVGERRTYTLPDGSQLQLNTRSAVDLRFSTQQRLLSLKHGEILLTCQPDPQGRPLRVNNRDGLFEASQGRFALRQQDDCTRLSVARGQVAIYPARGGPLTWARAGQSWQVDSAGARQVAVPEMDLGAWADGLIVTRDMRLQAFLEELVRYRHGYLSCAADIAELRLSGVFRLDDTDKLLALLPQTLPVRLHSRTRYWVRLERSV